MNVVPKFADYAPTAEAAVIVGESIDMFRQHVRTPGFPEPMKVGHLNFFSRSELFAWKRERDRKRKTK